ncbi:hypothetical protein ElyMa_000706100 [Elysia marginata]|uniref:Cadherin domain-containing protein n=1 Tax=Elysia marginata TaxID=1093978 RepID=A0AAV4GJG7_9GAST|nr:hypothetical protein ElyMa_000706100 [Elysia marginata]
MRATDKDGLTTSRYTAKVRVFDINDRRPYFTNHHQPFRVSAHECMDPGSILGGYANHGLINVDSILDTSVKELGVCTALTLQDVRGYATSLFQESGAYRVVESSPSTLFCFVVARHVPVISSGRVKGTDDDSDYNQNNWVYFGGGGGNFDIAANGWIVLNQKCLNGETYIGTATISDQGIKPGPLTGDPMGVIVNCGQLSSIIVELGTSMLGDQEDALRAPTPIRVTPEPPREVKSTPSPKAPPPKPKTPQHKPVPLPPPVKE